MAIHEEHGRIILVEESEADTAIGELKVCACMLLDEIDHILDIFCLEDEEEKKRFLNRFEEAMTPAFKDLIGQGIQYLLWGEEPKRNNTVSRTPNVPSNSKYSKIRYGDIIDSKRYDSVIEKEVTENA